MNTHIESLVRIGVYQGDEQAVLEDRALNNFVFREDDTRPEPSRPLAIHQEKSDQDLDDTLEIAIAALDIASKKSVQYKQELEARRTAQYAEIGELLELITNTTSTIENKQHELGQLQTLLPQQRDLLQVSMQERNKALEPIVDFGEMLKSADITLENLEAVNDLIIEFAEYLHKIAQPNENGNSEFIEQLLPSITFQYKIHETQKMIAKIETDITSLKEKLVATQKQLEIADKEKEKLDKEIFRYKKKLEKLYRREK